MTMKTREEIYIGSHAADRAVEVAKKHGYKFEVYHNPEKHNRKEARITMPFDAPPLHNRYNLKQR